MTAPKLLNSLSACERTMRLQEKEQIGCERICWQRISRAVRCYREENTEKLVLAMMP